MKLSPREQEVASCLALGLTNKEIASVLGIKLDTAKQHTCRIFLKLCARNRTEAAVKIARGEPLQ